jgi:hypothetical protein
MWSRPWAFSFRRPRPWSLAGLRLSQPGVTMAALLVDAGELLDRTLVWSQRHLMTVLREHAEFYNTLRPHAP